MHYGAKAAHSLEHRNSGASSNLYILLQNGPNPVPDVAQVAKQLLYTFLICLGEIW